jgi:hypothetical protein
MEKTQVYKSHYGWKAVTQIELDDVRVLDFTTMKRSNGMVATNATCMSKQEGSRFLSYIMFQDFSEQVQTDLKSSRATEKTVADQHQRALAKLEEVKARCAAFYDKSEATA